MSPEAPSPLGAEETARLVELARALKAAARALSLYPGGHPSIGVTLERVVQLTSPERMPAPLQIGVLADTLVIGGHPPARPDAAVSDLAALLSSHLVGELTVRPGGDHDGWRSFLKLIGRAPDEIRADGGIGRLWTTMAGRHIELREIDYAELLREKSSGDPITWERIIANCLQGESFLDDEALQGLLDMAGDPERLGNLIGAIESRATIGGMTLEGKTVAVVKMIQGLVDSIKKHQPERLDGVLRTVATAIGGRLSPEMMVSLLAHGAGGGGMPTSAATELVGAVVSRMTDDTIAHFVARNAVAEGGAIDRLAQAFHTLVRDGEQRERLLTLAHDEAESSPLGSTAGFEDVWQHVAERLLNSYSDETFVSSAYARELSGARTDAISVENASDDPPERVAAWVATVATHELRQLDVTLMADLLRIERDNKQWSELMTPLVSLVEDLLLVGDMEAAQQLVAVVKGYTGPDQPPERQQAAVIGFDLLAASQMLRHILTHLSTLDDTQFELVKAMCVSFGEVLVRPLAEALALDDRGKPRERLTAILLAFGAAGRRQVEQLKASANPVVRRTAIYLLREFGGSEALPDLTELLDDNEPQVQREAVRAILNIGIDSAFQVLEQALISGSATSREAIMRSLWAVRDERATPLFAHILEHVDHRGPLASIYLRAIEALGILQDVAGVNALKGALYRGEWWAPRRTTSLRRAAAASLARIGTADALTVLEEAGSQGSRGVRAAARKALADASRRSDRRMTA